MVIPPMHNITKLHQLPLIMLDKRKNWPRIGNNRVVILKVKDFGLSVETRSPWNMVSFFIEWARHHKA